MRKVNLIYKLLGFFIIILLIITVVDIVRISKYKIHPVKPKKAFKTDETKVYWDLTQGTSNIDWNRLDGTLKYIKNEYDCADFKLVNLIRIIYEYENKIPLSHQDKIKKTLLNFRYWLDEPGENSMCYWSENHQILFASAEYLIGKKYYNNFFPNSKLSGSEHMKKAKTRILDWLQMRWNYGFTEFYSEVYYKEDIAALVNLIDYADDKEITEKCKIILDLLFYDVATQSTNLMFVSTSGRAYENNRKGPRNLVGLTEYYWGNGKEINANIVYGLMQTKNYDLPPVLKEIARDSSNVVIKQSNGLNISELNREGFNNKTTSSLMMQWGMEAFVNPEVIRNSLYHIRKNKMFSNSFLGDFKQLDFSLLNYLHLEPLAIKLINPQFNGTAIQNGNTYTYKTKDYSLYTVQNYHPGNYADQHHVFGMNINNHFAIYHSHPAVEKGVKIHSPNYWVGYGHLPHSVQDENINLSIYNIPNKKGIIEYDLLKYTHAYFPNEKFDEVELHKNYIFGKKGDTYCALIGDNNLEYRESTTDDIIQKGQKVFWITEAGSKSQDGSFTQFVQRIKNNKIAFNKEKLALIYSSKGKKYQLNYKSDFMINSKIINTNYSRFDAPYIKSNRKPENLKIEFNDKTLYLDFYKMTREY